MDTVFLSLLNRSMAAGWLILAVVALRLPLKKAPRWITAALWGLVAVRLICPFSFESRFSLLPRADAIPPAALTAKHPAVGSGSSFLDPSLSESLAPQEIASVNPLQVLLFAASLLWIAGMLVMLLYALVSSLRLGRRVREAVRLRDNLWVCDHIPTAFIRGVLRPRIYLPSTMKEADRTCVVLHEQAHLKRRDPLWKSLGFLLLAVYWFHPLLWLAYSLLGRDIELACDERVLRECGPEIKRPYASALITYSVSRRKTAGIPLAFGEAGVKARVSHVLRYRKPALWISIAAVAACIVTAVCLLTNPAANLRDILDENGFTLVRQVQREVTLSIPREARMAAAAGGAFSEDEVVVCRTDTTSIYLERVRPAEKDGEPVSVVFNMSYRLPSGGTILLPYQKNENGSFSDCVSPQSTALDEEGRAYPDAVYLGSSGPERQFMLYVAADVWQAAAGTIRLRLSCNELTYAK